MDTATSSPGPLVPSSAAPSRPGRPRSRRRWRRAVLAVVLAVLLALGGATAWALDRFVIEHVEIADVSAYEEAATAATTLAEPVVTVTTGTVGTGEDTATYYVADVVLSDITQLRSAFAQNAFGLNITQAPSAIAADLGALLSVNGDYYGFRETGTLIRNGVLYRDEGARSGAVIYRDGTMAIYDETATTGAALLADGAWQTLSFGPALVDGGEVVAGIDQVEIDTNVGNHSIQGNQPRTAIGMISANHYVLVVVDGRSDASAGVTLPELADLLVSLGAQVAYNLDGGGSSVMVDADGELVNDPLGKGDERGTSDILYIASGE